MRTITLTDEQATRLKMFLLMSTNYRKGEIETWTLLSTERHEDGSLVWPNALSNVDWWRDANSSIEEVMKLLGIGFGCGWQDETK